MAPSYLDLQIADALTKAKGNPTKARAALIEMAAQDQRLLMILAKPYLTAISAQAINRYSSQAKKQKNKSDTLPPVPKGKGQGGFGLDLLKALGGHNVAKFGQEEAAPPISRKPASSQHVNALKMMASKSKSRPK